MSVAATYPRNVKNTGIWGYSIFFITCISAFIFDPQTNERWAQAIPFLVINMGIGLDTFHRNQNYQKRLSNIFNFLKPLNRVTNPKKWIFNNKIFSLLMISLILGRFSANIAYSISSPTINDWPYPNKIIIDEIVKNVPENALLILGRFDDWKMASYYHLGMIIYIDWGNQFIEAYFTQNETFSNRFESNILDESLISAIIKNYLDSGNEVYVHGESLPFLKAQGLEIEYSLSLYKEFRHWSPLDLIKGERNPNRIYILNPN